MRQPVSGWQKSARMRSYALSSETNIKGHTVSPQSCIHSKIDACAMLAMHAVICCRVRACCVRRRYAKDINTLGSSGPPTHCDRSECRLLHQRICMRNRQVTVDGRWRASCQLTADDRHPTRPPRCREHNLAARDRSQVIISVSETLRVIYAVAGAEGVENAQKKYKIQKCARRASAV
jgi:hypothetical protein